jgi:hypothetical protein
MRATTRKLAGVLGDSGRIASGDASTRSVSRRITNVRVMPTKRCMPRALLPSQRPAGQIHLVVSRSRIQLIRMSRPLQVGRRDQQVTSDISFFYTIFNKCFAAQCTPLASQLICEHPRWVERLFFPTILVGQWSPALPASAGMRTGGVAIGAGGIGSLADSPRGGGEPRATKSRISALL